MSKICPLISKIIHTNQCFIIRYCATTLSSPSIPLQSTPEPEVPQRSPRFEKFPPSVAMPSLVTGWSLSRPLNRRGRLFSSWDAVYFRTTSSLEIKSVNHAPLFGVGGPCNKLDLQRASGEEEPPRGSPRKEEAASDQGRRSGPYSTVKWNESRGHRRKRGV